MDKNATAAQTIWRCHVLDGSEYGGDCIAGKTIVRMSQYIIVGFGFFMGVMAIILLEIGLNLG